jgi:hypothetical protein
VDVFISHSTDQLRPIWETALEAAGLSVWFDHSELQVGICSRTSRRTPSATRGSYCRCAQETQLSRDPWPPNGYGLPCRPIHHRACSMKRPSVSACRGTSLLRTKRVTASVIEGPTRDVREGPDQPNELAPVIRAESPKLSAVIRTVATEQEKVGESLGY